MKPGNGFAVLNFPTFNHVERVFNFDFVYIYYFICIKVSFGRLQVGGQKDMNPLVRISGHRRDGSQLMPLGGRIAGFFNELPLGAADDRFLRIEGAGRNLPDILPESVTILLEQDKPVWR